MTGLVSAPRARRSLSPGRYFNNVHVRRIIHNWHPLSRAVRSARRVRRVSALYRCLSLRGMGTPRISVVARSRWSSISCVHTLAWLVKRKAAVMYAGVFPRDPSWRAACILRVFHAVAMSRRWRRENRVFGMRIFEYSLNAWPPRQATHNICHEGASHFSLQSRFYKREIITARIW